MTNRTPLLTILATLILWTSIPTSGLAIQAKSLPPDVLRTKITEGHANRTLASIPRFAQESFEFSVPSGKILTAKLLVPVRQSKKIRFPVLTIFGGLERAAKIIELLQPKVPMIIASFDYPFNAPKKFEFPQSLSYAPDAKRAVSDMLDAIAELHTKLKMRDDVDPAKITIIGVSFGAPFALASAANDPTISGVVVVHGIADVPGTVKHLLAKKWEAKLGPFAGPAAWFISNLAWIYLDGPAPEDSAFHLTSRQRVLMIQAEKDSYIPTASSNKLWKAIDESSAQREKYVTPGDHVDGDSERTVETLSEKVADWMKRSDLL